MSGQALARACQCLRINGISQARVSAFIDETLEATPAFPEHFEVLFKHVIAKSMWGDAESDDERYYILRVFIELGLKYAPAEAPGSGTEKQSSREPETLAQIEATYVAEYISDENLDQDAIKAFATQNASFHVWPYWREFITSQCDRMNLPRINLPLHNFGKQESDAPLDGEPEA